MKDNKDYEPNLIRNMLMEQDLIRKLSKIIINLNDKTDFYPDIDNLDAQRNVDTLVSIINKYLDQSFKTSKVKDVRESNKNLQNFKHRFPMETRFTKSQIRDEKNFLTYSRPINEAPKKHKGKEQSNNKIMDKVKQDLRNMQMLQDMDIFRFFKEFMFPIDIDSLKVFLKQNKSWLYTKNIKNLMAFEKLFTDYERIEDEKKLEKRGSPLRL